MKNIVYKSALENLASTMKGSNATYELSAKKNGRELRDWVFTSNAVLIGENMVPIWLLKCFLYGLSSLLFDIDMI